MKTLSLSKALRIVQSTIANAKRCVFWPSGQNSSVQISIAAQKKPLLFQNIGRRGDF
jgi:hypothetical protein